MSQRLEIVELNRRLELALDASGIGIWQHNATTGEIVWDARLRHLYGIGPEDPPNWIALVHPEDRPRAHADFLTALERQSDYSSRFRIVQPDGAIRHISSRAHFHRDENGDSLMIGAEWDVTLDVLREEELRRRSLELDALRREAERAATTDYLTDLPNRRALHVFIESRPLATGLRRAVLHIDLDDFKAINDRYGHEAGDQHLRRFALALRVMVPEGAFAARLGGDEFIVLLPSASIESASLLAATLVASAGSLGSHLQPDIGSASIGLSIGTGDWAQHIAASDAALYEAKRSGRGRYVIRTLDRRQEWDQEDRG